MSACANPNHRPVIVPRGAVGVSRAGWSYPDLVTVLLGLRENLRLARLQLITDVRGGPEPFVAFLREMFAAGVDLVQVRDTGVDDRTLRACLEAAVQPTFEHRALLCVGRRPDLAASLASDLLHLGASDGDLAPARAGLGRYSLVGRSVHTPAQLDEALAEKADWLSVGPVHGDGAPGLALVEQAARRLPVMDETALPWFAVGGITPGNLDAVLRAGAARVTLAGAVTRAADPEAVVREVSERVRAHVRGLAGADDYAFRVMGGPERAATLKSSPPPPAGAAPAS